MPPLLKQDDHYILGKLCDELLPWMICGRRVKDQWFVRFASFYGYTGDLAAAMAGLGIGTPLAVLAAGKTPPGRNVLDVLGEILPGLWVYVGAAAVVLWAVVRLVVQKEDVVARAHLARDCAQTMKGLKVELWRALAEPQPMQKITAIQKSVDDKVQAAVNNRVWPGAWDPLPGTAEIDAELGAALEEIRRRFMSHWDPPPPGAL